MITFEKIKIQNFMSVGNAPLELDYTKSKTTLVTATNGVGKSSIMMDSICFALYGKPYRNINKPQLVNSINGKACLVEISFKVGKVKYIVKRGIKPAIFEIYKNGTLLNQDAASRDYQKVLETNILKMNYRTFTQVVIMGSGNYIPFMKLSAQARREFIEDVLDIKIFSVMNSLLKQHMKDIDDEEKELLTAINLLKEKFKMQEQFIATLENEKETRRNEIQAEIEKLGEEEASLSSKIELLSLEVEQIGDQTEERSKVTKKLNDLKTIQTRLTKNIEKQQQNKEFFAVTEVCPTCHQEIGDHHRDHLIKTADSKVVELSSGLDELDQMLNDIQNKMANIESNQREVMRVQGEIGTAQSSMSVTQKLITKYQRELIDLNANTSSVDTEKKVLKTISKDIVHKDKERKDLGVTKQYNDAIAYLLKDTGIKTKIVKQYVPVFNKLINAYLQHLDLFVSFELDENFNETVKSRYRDFFTYESFSEGEKQRIDLAMLFTFREIARMKNAINVNLLIMDEVLDQSLDNVGVDNFFNIISGLPTSNLFVISHRESMQDKFDDSVRLVKHNNFTVLDKK